MRAVRAGALALALATGLVACQPLVNEGAKLGTHPLKAIPSPEAGQLIGCMQAALTGTLAGDPADPSRVWLVSGGERIELGWPYGFGASFEPEAVVVAPDGEVVARAGEEVAFGGGHVGDVFWICDMDGRSWPPYDG